MHSTNLDAISTPANFEEALALSKNYWLSFEIGDATGGGYDTLPFVEAHHDRIALIYLKDRQGPQEHAMGRRRYPLSRYSAAGERPEIPVALLRRLRLQNCRPSGRREAIL
jgi:hypothetical protein